MERRALPVRPNLDAIADAQGFSFANMYGEVYWDESSAYVFDARDVEAQIEDASTELHGMVREAVARVVGNERLMGRMGIPEGLWDFVRHSWLAGEAELYGRFDLVWDGKSPAKMLEYNADTPTSLFEAASFQWQWLEDMKAAGHLPAQADQFNGIYEALVARFRALLPAGTVVHFASEDGNAEDYGTVETLGYAAREAGMGAYHTTTQGIGLATTGQLADDQDRIIGTLFKLHPWEDVLSGAFAPHLATARCRFLEPAWKALVSNKAILPVLWDMYEGHPNLLPSFFEEDVTTRSSAYTRAVDSGAFAAGQVRKPLFSREGSSITILDGQQNPIAASEDRSYDHHPSIVQAYHPMPVFDGQRPLIGAWVVGTACVGMGIREDSHLITQNLSRFKPHAIL